ncbi:hypothetical protein D9756_004851 [Leucocoprinus leucothites]|uniref:DASH complex subunit DAD1 n=1 Tax=Leucocoprinus leucothites TaxID=201217 RepID=A0A8H5LKP3_9AGAR|nr:hypothetical protein D9756_004851 [Leucoagaricus leucothites]
MEEESSFFDRERDRLAREITTGFEELLSSSNALNRKLEEVLGMTREYETIASLWHSFYRLMRESGEDDSAVEDIAPGLPGTGGHIIAGGMKQSTTRNGS